MQQNPWILHDRSTRAPPLGAPLPAGRRFRFAHGIDAILLGGPGLSALAARLPRRDVYCSTSSAGIDTGWERPRDQRDDARLLLAADEGRPFLILLRNVDADPVLGGVFRDLLARIAGGLGADRRRDIVRGRVTLLISSPGRVTHYHIDDSDNFLLQLRGSKRVHVLDGADRALLTDRELEAFYAGDDNAARYAPWKQAAARQVRLVPGTGLHVPPEWPHWVRNGSALSVSASVNYDLRSVARRRTLFRANRLIRRAGWAPTTPGRSPARDLAKLLAARGGGLCRSALRATASLVRRPS